MMYLFLFADNVPYTHQARGSGYACRYCKKMFPVPAKVVNHERIHTGERPFSCQICGKSFAEKGTLKRHQIIHT